jgi:hypothetical protein
VLEVVWRSIWQFLDAILLAAWWLGIGRLLRQDHLRPIPPVAGARRGRSSRGRRQRRRAKFGTRCSAWRALRAMDRVVDFAPGGICAPNPNISHHLPVMTRPPPRSLRCLRIFVGLKRHRRYSGGSEMPVIHSGRGRPASDLDVMRPDDCSVERKYQSWLGKRSTRLEPIFHP